MSREHDHWDMLSRGPEGELRVAIWGEPHIQNSWQLGVQPCLEQILPITVPEHPNTPKTILEIGCGVGRLLVPIAQQRRDWNVIGVDFSEGILSIANSEARRNNLCNIFLHLSKGHDLPPIPLHVVFSIAVFQHMPREDMYGYIEDVGRYLTSGGIFRFQFIDGDYDYFLSHACPLSTVESLLCNCGLTVEKIEQGIIQNEWTWVTARKL